jgi:hypothetical protein
VAEPSACSASSVLARSKLIMACSPPLLPGRREGASQSRTTGLATKTRVSANGSHPTCSPSGSSASSPFIGVSARTARAVSAVSVSRP